MRPYHGRVSQPSPSLELRGASALANELVQELLRARSIGVLATLEPDGSVHAVAMWLALTDGAVLLATGSRSRKVRNLERDPRATLVVHDSRPGAEVCGASLRGRAELVRGPDAKPLIERVHRRYLDERSLSLPEVLEFLSFDDVAIRFVPEAFLTWVDGPRGAARVVRESGGALPLEPTTPR